MFSMLQGPWPRVTSDGVRLAALEADVAAGRAGASVLRDAVERLVAEAVAAQVETGMGLVTDGSVRWADPVRAVLDALRARDTGPDGMLVRAWRATAGLADGTVAQAIPGPWTLAIRDVGAALEADIVAGRAADLADALAGELEALAAAGCPVVQVMEPEAVAVGEEARLRSGFLRAQQGLLARVPDVHAMLVVAGGSAVPVGPDALFGAPYSSYLFDLIEGADNWYLVRAAPPDRGIICAALVAGGGAEAWDQAPQLVWAARYAASAGSRGLERVGLANASVLGGLDPAAARRALEALARASSLAALPVGEALEAGLDPRTVNTLPTPGRAAPRRTRPP